MPNNKRNGKKGGGKKGGGKKANKSKAKVVQTPQAQANEANEAPPAAIEHLEVNVEHSDGVDRSEQETLLVNKMLRHFAQDENVIAIEDLRLNVEFQEVGEPQAPEPPPRKVSRTQARAEARARAKAKPVRQQSCVVKLEEVRRFEAMGARRVLNIVKEGPARAMRDLVPNILSSHHADEHVVVVGDTRSELDAKVTRAVLEGGYTAYEHTTNVLLATIKNAQRQREMLDRAYAENPAVRPCISPAAREQQRRHLGRLAETVNKKGLNPTREEFENVCCDCARRERHDRAHARAQRLQCQDPRRRRAEYEHWRRQLIDIERRAQAELDLLAAYPGLPYHGLG